MTRHHYPHRHLAVLAHRGATAERLTDVLAAVDVLTELGWELINVAEIGDGHSRMTSAVMRRRGKI